MSILENVTSNEKLNETLQKLFFDKHSNESLIGLMNSTKYDQKMQTFMALANEFASLPKNDTYEETIKFFEIKMMDMMEKVRSDNQIRARQIGSIISRLSERYENNSDPDIAKHASEICEKASYEYQYYIRHVSKPESMTDEVKETTKAFSDCLRSNSVPNLEILEAHETINMTSTPFPPLEFPVIPEDYADYVNDQNISKISSKYDAASNKIVSLCYLNAKSLTLTMLPGNETESGGNDFFQITATKKLGKDIPGTKVSSQNVEVQVSEDFVRYNNEEVSILFCTSTRNPFWYISKEKITTSVAMVKFMVENIVVNKFEKPFFISFENTDKNFSWIPLHETAIPRRPNVSTPDGDDFEKMAIFRIDVLSQQDCVVEFLDLATGIVLDVYISDFAKPTPDEFKDKSTQIHEHNKLIISPQKHDFNSWHYLCIMPNEKMGDQTVAAKFRVYAMSCSSLQSENRAWVFSCGAATTSSLARIDCICYHSSVFVGRVTANFVKEERTIIFNEHELELQSNLVIFVSVAVAFFLYCMLLIMICVSSDWDYGRRLYVVGDMPGFPIREYLIIVRTGSGFTAGTTSNVVIKLYGKEAVSR
ncbi:hypothetical protein JTB14_012739 [Gonioctena quinquepunctata]|nr:hypothetical protein JTB14_012739 [Gonioctena quinquepunctata]